MPGPSNKKKRKSQGKAQRKKSIVVPPQPEVADRAPTPSDASHSGCSSSNPELQKRRVSKSSLSSGDSHESPNRIQTPATEDSGQAYDGLFILEKEVSDIASPIDVLDLDERLQRFMMEDDGQRGFARVEAGDCGQEEEERLGDSPPYSYPYSDDQHDSDSYTPTYDILPQKPYIHNPGNGPRVRDIRAFLASGYFAQAPAFNDPLCAEFAQEEVLQMLQTVLPDEMALILWYNKSRATSRICPACQRLYRLGDILPDHKELLEEAMQEISYSKERSLPHPQLLREQQLSGLCSTMCFILSSFNQFDPRGTVSAWGHTVEEIDDESWAALNDCSSLGPSTSGDGQNKDESLAKSLVMLVRMTRLPDLGLAQLCFPDVA
ncbi:hypothetical protein D9758_006214 [Tetrapyrgos nigripes]|uniref:Uncharacterized protein n=1 Tax=Tetrapyrgos nigripes TaxID=182062 RepID=A0A8H5GAX8_9AGAR|nr:hypothetical protein D9758_006214 [Tetrapyrgos nigripes]